MIGTRSAGFQIAEQGVDPPELGQIPGLAATGNGNDHIMLTIRIAYAIETTQAISQYAAARVQGTTRPVLKASRVKPEIAVNLA